MTRDDLPVCDCPKSTHRHGTNRMYNVHKCRCFACRVARSRCAWSYRHGGGWREADRASAVGARRRLQALATLGHTVADIAARTGLSPDMVAYLRLNQNEWIAREKHELVCRVYDELWATRNESSNGKRCASLAHRSGYAPPLAWDDETIDDPAARPHVRGDVRTVDEVAVERAIAGDLHTRLTKAERVEAVRRMTEQGLSAREIGRRLKTHHRAVTRDRAEVRAA